MNTTTLKAGATHGGPMVFGAGAAMLAVALVGSGQGGGVSAAPRPTPTVTVTATPAEQTPAPRPSRTVVARTVVEAQPADQQTASNGRAAGSDHSESNPSGGGDPTTAPRPAPGPSTSPPAVQPSRCEGAVSVRLPLGVLPRCAITIGGNR